MQDEGRQLAKEMRDFRAVDEDDSDSSLGSVTVYDSSDYDEKGAEAFAKDASRKKLLEKRNHRYHDKIRKVFSWPGQYFYF